VADVARTLALHEGRNDAERDAEILRWCEDPAAQFDDARIQTFVPILVEHIVNNRIHRDRRNPLQPEPHYPSAALRPGQRSGCSINQSDRRSARRPDVVATGPAAVKGRPGIWSTEMSWWSPMTARLVPVTEGESTISHQMALQLSRGGEQRRGRL
jgi:hypothetical protein